ncbi:MAG TPA: AarF/UbiB family protein [Gemmatimonadaceae bacterium]|nr:AarF/UbiB family protein [Gemmatimonadaceae bacterium]
MRTIIISIRILPFLLSFARDHRRWLVAGRPVARDPGFHRDRAGAIVAAIASLGPTFVKLAQVFAARADLIPEPYLGALGALHDRVPPIPFEDVEATIVASYGQSVDSLFERFDRQPVAAASLGQVHRARLAGEDVAVKVLRPGVEALVAQDVRAAATILRVIGRVWPNRHVIALQGVVAEFAVCVGDEMDFRKEAVVAEEIGANFRGHPRLIIPRVIPGMVRQRVLVLEFVEGRRIDALGPWIAEGRVTPRVLVRTVMEMYIQMMLVDGLFHADPHPGNLLVAPNGKLVLLDFGMAVRVPRELRRRLIETVFASIRADVEGIVRGFESLGIIQPGADPASIRALIAKLLSIANSHTVTRERMAQLLADEVMQELFDAPVVLPSNLVYFARTASLIEGIGTRYDPRFNAIEFATPLALRMRPRIRASLRGDALPARDDWAASLGGLIGEVAGVVHRAGRELASIVGGRLFGLGSVADTDRAA